MINLATVENIFSCPICRADMTYKNGASLVCKANHCFDRARLGYVNMLQKQILTDYNKEMFTARREIFRAGYYNPLLDKISSILKEISPKIIVDAGCGEGFQLSYIKSALSPSPTAIGIDVSRDGITIASREDKQSVWLVADLASIPLKNSSVDGLINILSPANYKEFSRVVRKGGYIIKVVPGESYLAQIRQSLYRGTSKESHSSSDTVGLMKESFPNVNISDISYNISPTKAQLEDFIKMSPISWGAKNEDISAILEKGLKEITLDFRILTAKT